MDEVAVWESRKIHYVLTFSQGPIGSDVYLHLPSNWFGILKTGLEDESFKQNKVDPCLFVRHNCFVI